MIPFGCPRTVRSAQRERPGANESSGVQALDAAQRRPPAKVRLGAGPIFRLQSTLSATYRIDGLTLGLANHYKSSYADQSLDREVSPYITWDTFGSYAFDKSTSVTFGVRNLFDKAPPFSNQTATFQVGYDPRFADPFMRTFYARGTYRF